MTTGLFSFEDAVHSHTSIGDVEGCLACAQTRTDMALSAAAYHASREQATARPLLVRVPVMVSGRKVSSRKVSGNTRKSGTLSSVA